MANTQRLQAIITLSGQSRPTLNKELTAAKNRVNSIGRSLDDTNKKARDFNLLVRQARVSGQPKAELDRIRQSEIQARLEASRLRREWQESRRTVKLLADDSQRLTAEWIRGANLAANALLGLGAAATGVLVAVTRKTLEYNLAINTTAAITAATIEQTRRFSDQARFLGLTTEKTATEAARGQTELARAGFSLNEVLAATPGVFGFVNCWLLGYG